MNECCQLGWNASSSFFGYVKMCKFISSLIYSTLWLYMSCWWLQFQNSGVRLVQAWTNTRRENQFCFCRCCSTRYDVCVYFFSFSFRLYVSFLSSFVFLFRWICEIHGDSFKSMLLKRDRFKRKGVYVVVDADSFHVSVRWRLAGERVSS